MDDAGMAEVAGRAAGSRGRCGSGGGAAAAGSSGSKPRGRGAFPVPATTMTDGAFESIAERGGSGGPLKCVPLTVLGSAPSA